MSTALANAQPARLRVAMEIRDWIERGRYGRGEALPTEMALTTTFGVSRPTVRAALALLEEEGLIGRDRSRARTVLRQAAAPISPLANTVALLADGAGEIPGYQKQSGWWIYVQTNATATIRAAKCHTLFLDLESLDDGLLHLVTSQRPRGLIDMRSATLGERGLRVVRQVRQAGIPVVVCGHEPTLAEFDMVGSDHALGAYQLTRWLLERGHRHILRTFPRSPRDCFGQAWVGQRQTGFERAMHEAGIAPLPLLTYQAFGREPATAEEADYAARAVAGYLVEQFRAHPEIDTIMVPSDGIVYQTATACRILGREPGRDITIVGYDNYWRDCLERSWEAYIPPVTVDKRNPELGTALAQMLLDRAAGRLGMAPLQRLIEPLLLEIHP